jgi:integral membrane sensor domain MASE1
VEQRLRNRRAVTTATLRSWWPVSEPLFCNLQESLRVVFFTVFVVSFMSADYLITGSVTNTWIGIAFLVGTISAVIRWFVSRMLELAFPDWETSPRR